jgi:hypothetical protein
MASDLNSLLNQFKKNRFSPNTDSETTIPDQAGNYIICLKPNSKLPPGPIVPNLRSFEGLKVIYTGIASGSLRCRDYRQHFKGNNAGRSTLRKSLGVLFGYKLVQRDKDPSNGKTKFGLTDEKKLSDWMNQNLIMFFLPTTNYAMIEITLINHFNPPLNLKDNHNAINADFRKLLSTLRSGRTIGNYQGSNTTSKNPIKNRKIAQAKTANLLTNFNYDSKIIKVIDDKLLETGKLYMLLGQANQLLLSKGLIGNNKVLKQMLEKNEIPYAQKTDTVPKQWRIPLSKVGEKRRKAIEKNDVNAMKRAEKIIATKEQKLPIEESYVQDETSQPKTILNVVAVCCWIGSCNELTKINTPEFSIGFFLFALVLGIVIYTKASSIIKS